MGSTPYTSKYTGKLEQLPAAVGIAAAKGSDLMLADLVSKLFEEKEVISISTGTSEVPAPDEL